MGLLIRLPRSLVAFGRAPSVLATAREGPRSTSPPPTAAGARRAAWSPVWSERPDASIRVRRCSRLCDAPTSSALLRAYACGGADTHSFAIDVALPPPSPLGRVARALLGCAMRDHAQVKFSVGCPGERDRVVQQLAALASGVASDA